VAASLSDLQARLTSLSALITSIENAQTQEFWDNGYRHRAPELPALYAERRKLDAEISLANASANGSRCRRISFVR
jgi:hypothetical protein